MQILSPSEATEARESLGMSQAHVARAVGLNRLYLSQFEGGKRVLEDRWQTNLREYFIGEGWEDAQAANGPQEGRHGRSVQRPLNTIDGFVIAAHIEHQEAETLLGEYYIANDLMDQMAETELEPGFFGDLGFKDAVWQSREYLALAMRQCQIVRILRGHETADTNDASIPRKVDTPVRVYGRMASVAAELAAAELHRQ